MASFFCKRKDYFISTNLKVASRTLENQPLLVKANRGMELANMLLKNIVASKSKPHYLLVRNPYKRVESFFKEKLRKRVIQATATPPYHLKLHQEIFYPYLGLTPGDPVEKIQHVLLSLSFEQYIKILPEVFHKDAHLHPQKWIFRQWVKRVIPVYFTFDKIVPIDQEDGKKFLKEVLLIDLKIRINPSSDFNDEVRWTRELLDIVNDVYEEDFIGFDYKMK